MSVDTGSFVTGTRQASPLPATGLRMRSSEAGRHEVIRSIEPTDPYLAGHYPDHQVYPGVFIIENVLAAAREAVLAGRADNPHVSLSRIRSVRFTAPVESHGELTIEMTTEMAVEADRDTVDRVIVSANCLRADGVKAAKVVLEVCLEHPEPAFEAAEIRRLLDHRHPILLVEKVLEYDPGHRITTTKAVSVSEPCYATLPASAPQSAYRYPDTLVIESFGQSGALLWLKTMAETDTTPDGVLFLASARDCVIEGHAYPGDVLRHEVRLDKIVGDNAFLSGQTWVGDRRIAAMGSAVAVIRPAG